MNKKIISIFCMLLIITIPLTFAQFSETDLSPTTVLSGTYGKQDLGEAIVVNVAGYEPPVLESSSIESGTGLAYVYLKGTTFGTLASTITGKSQPDLATGLTNIPPIKSMIIQPDKESLKYLSSPPKYFKPAKNAFSLNNLGQIVLNFKQIPKEEDVPEKIDLNFTATITFDLEQGSLFGISQQSLIMKPHPVESEWLESPDSQKDKFFAGRGFIRLTSTTGKARFVIYDKYLNPINIAENAIAPQLSTTDLTKEATVPLSVGEVSEPIVLGSTGDLFLDSFRIRLNQIIEPQNKAYARLTVYGNTYDTVLIKNKPIYPGSNWKVSNIYIREVQDKKSFTKQTKEDFLNYVKTKFGYTVTIEDLELPKEISSIYTTTHVLELENRNGDRAIIETIFAAQDEQGSQNLLDQISKPIMESEAESILSKYCPAAITKNNPPEVKAENSKLHQSYYICNSIEDYKKIINDYPSITREQGEAQSNEAAFKLGEIFFDKQIPYTGESKYFSDMRKLALYFYTKIPDTSEYFQITQEKIDSLTTTIGGSSFLPDESVGIDLKRVQLLTQQDKSNAEIIVNSIISSQPAKKYFEGDVLTDELSNQLLIGRDSSGKYNWAVEKVTSKSVVFKKKYIDNKGLTGSQITAQVNEEVSLPIKTILTEKEEYVSVKIERINSNVEADVTILPGIGEAFSTSSFQVHIPIDKRLFKFSKEQLEDQIKKTQKLIEKLDNVIEKLDKLVVALKKTCLVVSTALIVKNSFFTGTARNTARKEIMKVYDEKCRNEISQGLNRGKYVSQDGCYQHYSSDIESALDGGESAVDAALKEYKEKTQKKDGKYMDKDFNNYLTAGGTPDDYKTYLIYKELSSQDNLFNPEDQKYFEANKKLIDAQIPYDRKITQIENATVMINQINDKRKAEGKEPLSSLETEREMRFIINALENQEVTGTGLLADAPLELSNVRDIRNTNEFEALIPSKDQKNPLTRLDLVAPTLLALKMKEAGFNTEDGYRKKLTNDLREQNKELTPDAATNKANEQIKEYRGHRAYNNHGDPIFIPKESYDSVNGVIISNPAAYYTSNIFPFEGGQSIRDEYIEQTSYRTGGTINAQFTTDGYVYCYPIGQGDYTLVNNWFKTGLPDLSSTFIYNVGSNGRMECGKGDDVLRTTPQALAIDKKLYSRVTSILNRVGQCKNSGDPAGSLAGTGMKVTCSFDQAKLNEAGTAVKCTDTMDPNECKLLFNFCDPVMCPASRCNLGGNWKVDDVIGSGLIGSTVLCWPNRKDGVMIPVCLTGISAGLRNIRTILQGYQSCLETSLKEGRNVGLCDYIRSIGMCEILWKEALFMIGAKGGIMDWALSKVSPNSGGEEYTRFRQSFDQASKSFNYYTTEYSQSLLAQYKGKSFQEVGSTVCRLAVNGKIPNIGDVVDQLSQPEDPPQFTAVFDETIDVTDSGITPTGRPSESQSYYRGFYHIYAGKGYEGSQLAPTGYQNYVQYQVYLKSTTKSLSILYVTIAGASAGTLKTLQSQIVRSSSIKRGEFVQQSINVRGESGYDQICVVINGKTSCGFGKASSAFGMKALQDSVVYDEANRGIIGEAITTSDQCRPDYPRTSPSLGSLTMPEQFGILNSGIVRVCNPTPPGPEDIWRPVGDCGNDKNNKYLGKCWLNQESIKLNDAEKAGKLATGIEEKARNFTGVGDFIIPVDESRYASGQLNGKRLELIDKLRNLYGGLKEKKKDLGKNPIEKKPTEEPIPKTVPGEVPNKDDETINGGCRYDGVFKFDKSDEGSIIEGKEKLNTVIERLKANKEDKIYVYGFASIEGETKYNLGLSQKRANTIKDLLEKNDLTVELNGLGETITFDEENVCNKDETIKACTNRLKTKESANRRFVISTKSISKESTKKTINKKQYIIYEGFKSFPEAGSTSNCESTAKTEIKQTIVEPEPKQTIVPKAIIEGGVLKSIEGDFKNKKVTQITVEQVGKIAFLSTNDFTVKDSLIEINTNKLDSSKEYRTITVYITGEKPIVLKWTEGFKATGNVIAVTSSATDETQSEKPIPQEISPTDKISDDFKIEVLKTAREQYDSFNQLTTDPTKTIEGDELIKDRYTYEGLIKLSADSGITAESLLQRAEFYRKLGEFVYELIGEKPVVPLKPQTQIIKSKFTADTADKITINGDFDFKNYDYFISITDNNDKKVYINANKDTDGITYEDKSITLGDKYGNLAGKVKSILITVYLKGTTEYPLTFIELSLGNNFGKEQTSGLKEGPSDLSKEEIVSGEKYGGKEYNYVLLNPSNIELKVKTYGGVFENNPKTFGTKTVKQFYAKLKEERTDLLMVVNGGYYCSSDDEKLRNCPKDSPQGLLIEEDNPLNPVDNFASTAKDGVLIVTASGIGILKDEEYKIKYPNNEGVKQGIQGHLLFDRNTDYHADGSRYCGYTAYRNIIGINCNEGKIAFVQSTPECEDAWKFMKDKLGCEKAINLDGGGSTSMTLTTKEGAISPNIREKKSSAFRSIANVIAVYGTELPSLQSVEEESKQDNSETIIKKYSVDYYVWPGAWYTTYYKDYAASVGYEGLFAVQQFPMNDQGEFKLEGNHPLLAKYPIEKQKKDEIFRLETDGKCTLDMFKKALSNDICCVTKGETRYDTDYCVPQNKVEFKSENQCGSGLNVLMYHELTNQDNCKLQNNPRYCMTSGRFEEQLKYLKDKNCNVISPGEFVSYVRNNNKIKGSVLISFDDGSESDYNIALPLLKKYDFPAMFAITTGNIGKSGYLSLDQLKKLSQDDLVTIASHSKSHGAEQTYAKSHKNEELVKEEIKESKEILEGWLSTSEKVSNEDKCSKCGAGSTGMFDYVKDAFDLCKESECTSISGCKYTGKTFTPCIPETEEVQSTLTGTGFSFVILSDVHEDQITGTLNKILNSINPSLSSKPIKYIILNGDLYMKGSKICEKGTGDTCETQQCKNCYKDWYNKIKSKAVSLNAELLVTPGNHDQKTSLDYYKEGIQGQDDGAALITLDYKTRKDFNADLSNYNKVFVFSHVPFVDHAGAKEPGLRLNNDFINELKGFDGQCALISGHSHVYATKTESRTGCLGVGDGVAGGDLRGQRPSYTLVEVYDKGFKVCKISEENNFNFKEDDCKTVGQKSNTQDNINKNNVEEKQTTPTGDIIVDIDPFEGADICLKDTAGSSCAEQYGTNGKRPCKIKESGRNALINSRKALKNNYANNEFLIVSSQRSVEYQKCLYESREKEEGGVCGPGSNNYKDCPHVKSAAIDLCVYDKSISANGWNSDKVWGDNWADCRLPKKSNEIYHSCACRYIPTTKLFLSQSDEEGYQNFKIQYPNSGMTKEEFIKMKNQVGVLNKVMRDTKWNPLSNEWWHYSWPN